MIKKLSFVALLGLLSFNTFAQEESIRFGAKAGLNIASISGDDTDDLDSRIGFHLGAVVEIPISEKFAFQPELLFSTQGAKIEESFSEAGFEGSFEEVTKLNYLNLPLMFKFYAAQGFSIQAGPQVGFLLSANAEGEETFDGETEEFDEDVKEFYKGIDFGLNFGLGYQLESGIFFDGRYNLGLSNIADVENDEDDFSIQNSVIQFSVGYKF